MSLRLDGQMRSIAATVKAEPELRKLRKAADELEASLVKQMLSTLRKGVHENAIGKSYGGDMFKDMFDDAFAQAVTPALHLGVADQVMVHTAPRALEKALRNLDAEARAKEATAGQEANP